MKNLLKYRQNKWSEIGKDFFAKMRKNTQEFSSIEFCNLLKTNKIKNKEKQKMDKIYQRLGNARSIR